MNSIWEQMFFLYVRFSIPTATINIKTKEVTWGVKWLDRKPEKLYNYLRGLVWKQMRKDIEEFNRISVTT